MNCIRALLVSLFLLYGLPARSQYNPDYDSLTSIERSTADEYYSEEAGSYEDDSENTIYPYSEATSKPVTIDQDKWNKLTDDEDLKYNELADLPLNSPSMEAFANFLEFLMTKGIWIIWLLVGLLVAFTLYKILKSLNISRNQIVNANEVPILTEDAVHMDYEQLIQNSIADNNISKAVELMYQHIIILMQQKKEITIQQYTTNAQILNKSRQLPYYNILKKLLVQFEYVCFGEYPISKVQFEAYTNIYQELKLKFSDNQSI